MTTDQALMRLDEALRTVEENIETPWLDALDARKMPLAVHDKLILVLDAVRNARREAADHLATLEVRSAN